MVRSERPHRLLSGKDAVVMPQKLVVPKAEG